METKITVEQIESWEKTALLDAIGSGIELNDEFIDRYCGSRVKHLLSRIDEPDREFWLDEYISEENSYFNGTPASQDSEEIWLDVSEIETQFEGKAEDYFEDPDEFTINGNFAYLYVGYGLSVKVDCDKLEKDWIECANDNLKGEMSYSDSNQDKARAVLAWLKATERSEES